MKSILEEWNMKAIAQCSTGSWNLYLEIDMLKILAGFSTFFFFFLAHLWPGNRIVHRVPLRTMILSSGSQWEIIVFFETTLY